nr:cytochrome c oxidase subunit 2 [Saemundssonia lari]
MGGGSLKIYPFYLPDSFSAIHHNIDLFHDLVMVVVISILAFVFAVLSSLFFMKEFSRNYSSSELLESVWTVLPCIILVFLAAPSLVVLYLADELISPSITVKAVGHQWYWSYEYGNTPLSFDSYMVPTEEIWSGGFRLLEVDKRTPLPVNTEVRMIVTSSDVIHSWTVPSLGVKADAIPGRLNQISLTSLRGGLAYGQCSEICGANHAFMPICLELLPADFFFKKLEV